MSAHDHRSPRPPDRRARWPAIGDRPATLLPGARRRTGRRCARRSGSRIAPRAARGYALTFDDGPHAQGTPAVLEMLAARRRARRPSSSSASRCGATPRSAREIVAAGPCRSACTATATATCCASTPWQVREDIARAQAAIEDATGVSPALYRPPYGVLNAAALRLARARGWRTLLWSHWGRDWEARATPESIAARVTDGAGEGSVLLLHDADDYSAPGLLAAHGRGAAARARHARRARPAARSRRERRCVERRAACWPLASAAANIDRLVQRASPIDAAAARPCAAAPRSRRSRARASAHARTRWWVERW